MRKENKSKIILNKRSSAGEDLYALAEEIVALPADRNTIPYLNNHITGEADLLCMLKWMTHECGSLAEQGRSSLKDFSFTKEDVAQLSQFGTVLEMLKNRESVRAQSLELMTRFPEALQPFINYLEAFTHYMDEKYTKQISLAEKQITIPTNN